MLPLWKIKWENKFISTPINTCGGKMTSFPSLLPKWHPVFSYIHNHNYFQRRRALRTDGHCASRNWTLHLNFLVSWCSKAISGGSAIVVSYTCRVIFLSILLSRPALCPIRTRIEGGTRNSVSRKQSGRNFKLIKCL